MLGNLFSSRLYCSSLSRNLYWSGLRNASNNSYAKGNQTTSTHPIFDTTKVNTVGKLLDGVYNEMPHKDVYIHVEAGDKWTNKEARSHINSIANGLPEANVLPNKRFLSIQQNDSENFAIRLGTTRAGIIPVHIDINQFSFDSVNYFLDTIQPRSLVLTPKHDIEKKVDIINETYPEIAQNWTIGHPLKLEKFQDLKLLFHTHKYKTYDGWVPIKDIFWYDESPRTLPPSNIKPSDVAEIHFSRFNEFALKPMEFSHESIVQSAYNFGSVAPFSDKRVAFADNLSNPENATSMLSCISFGSVIINSTFIFRPSIFIKDLSNEYCNVLVTSPSRLQEIINYPKLNQVKLYLESIVVINNPLDIASKELLDNAKNILNLNEVNVSFISDGCISPFLYSSIDYKSPLPSSSSDKILGKPIPNCEIKITDKSGNNVPIGTSGRLFTKGVHTLKGYYNDSKCDILNNEKWLDTGIDGTMNKDGEVVYNKSSMTKGFTFDNKLAIE